MKLIFMSVILLVVTTGCRFAEVDHGVYRGPQPRAEDIEQAAKYYGLKTIINLRGEHPGSRWYDEEKAAADANGVTMINIGMSAREVPTRENLIKLLDAFKSAQRPLLIHCKAGVDRSGEAAAIYQMIYKGKSVDEALEMLSPKYGHFEGLMPAKRFFIKHVWKGEDWAYKEYEPCGLDFGKFSTTSPACLARTVNAGDGAPATPADTEAED